MKTFALTTLVGVLAASTASAAGPADLQTTAFQMKRLSYQLSRELRANFAFTPHYRSLRAYNLHLYSAADRVQALAFHPHAGRLVEVEVEEIALRLGQVTRLVEDLKDVVAGPTHAPGPYGHVVAGPTLHDLEQLCAIVDCMDEKLLELRTCWTGLCPPSPPAPPVHVQPAPPVLQPPVHQPPVVQPPIHGGVRYQRPALHFRKGRVGFSLVLN